MSEDRPEKILVVSDIEYEQDGEGEAIIPKGSFISLNKDSEDYH